MKLGDRRIAAAAATQWNGLQVDHGDQSKTLPSFAQLSDSVAMETGGEEITAYIQKKQFKRYKNGGESRLSRAAGKTV